MTRQAMQKIKWCSFINTLPLRVAVGLNRPPIFMASFADSNHRVYVERTGSAKSPVLWSSTRSQISGRFQNIKRSGCLHFRCGICFLNTRPWPATLVKLPGSSIQPVVEFSQQPFHHLWLFGSDVAGFSISRTVIVEFVVPVIVGHQSMRVRADRSSFGIGNC
jgi:hypothetical protein